MKSLPVGIDDFEKVRSGNYYYVDKTGLIRDIINQKAEVTLFTRPRRFGKTLNMSMLKNFFEIGTDPALFDGLAISEEKELCEKYLGRFPVISISLKDVGGNSYEEACGRLVSVINEEARRIRRLIKEEALTADEKGLYEDLLDKNMGMQTLGSSLSVMAELLNKCCGRKVIILIDEYDVPLDKANQQGYYNQMITLIGAILGDSLKTNANLDFAVLTGCMRISKESIFTGLNNFDVRTISDTKYDEYFGLTDAEVKTMLQCYGLEAYYPEVKQWYDGYLFGNNLVYCPWSIIKYVNYKKDDPAMEPVDYWANSSGNAVIGEFLSKYGDSVSEDFEKLLNGESLFREITENLTYGEIMTSKQNIWSLLYMSGYLTKDRTDRGIPVSRKNFFVKIPNMEVRDVFAESAKRWMLNSLACSNRNQLFDALWNKDSALLTMKIGDLLFNTISYHDYAESFYHAFLVGLLSNDIYKVESNYENGLGRSDIVVKDSRQRRAVIIEVKVSETGNDLEVLCDVALKQIKTKRYSEKIKADGYRKVVEYGITFYKKDCLVKKGEDSIID